MTDSATPVSKEDYNLHVWRARNGGRDPIYLGGWSVLRVYPENPVAENDLRLQAWRKKHPRANTVDERIYLFGSNAALEHLAEAVTALLEYEVDPNEEFPSRDEGASLGVHCATADWAKIKNFESQHGCKIKWLKGVDVDYSAKHADDEPIWMSGETVVINLNKKGVVRFAKVLKSFADEFRRDQCHDERQLHGLLWLSTEWLGVDKESWRWGGHER